MLYCHNEIQDLIKKNLIRPDKSLWSCSVIHAYKATKIERGAPRLVTNYKLLNKALKWM